MKLLEIGGTFFNPIHVLRINPCAFPAVNNTGWLPIAVIVTTKEDFRVTLDYAILPSQEEAIKKAKELVSSYEF